ncbi:MAG: O-antigen ligase family protein [Gammaproteobacteria bacterium]|nr:O-antigen ligase family protein [Gammaproteobacteria bacterium]
MTRRITGLAYVLMVLLVVLAPLPLGSNREWSWSLAAALTGVVGLLWLVAGLLRPVDISAAIHPAIPTLFVFALLWAGVQTCSATPSSWHHPLWSMTSETLGMPLLGRVSLAPQDGWTAIMRLTGYALLFLVAMQLGRSERRARAVFGWLTMAGLAYAVFGLAVYWGGLHPHWLFGETVLGHDLRSTFVNRNHFATWQGLTILCALAYFYQRMVRPEIRPYAVPKDRETQVEEFVLKSWKPMIALVLMVTALVLTHSRGGFLSTVAGASTLLWLLDKRVSARPGEEGRRKLSRIIAGTALAVASIAFFLTSEVLLDRIERTDVTSEERVAVFGNIQRAIGDNPGLGFGYGTFADSFRLYDQNEGPVHYDKAHNTWLENAFELGVMGATVLYLALAGLALTCWKGVRRRHRDWVYPATGMAASILIGVHALMDFSVQIPAVAMLFALILGIGCSQSYSSLKTD